MSIASSAEWLAANPPPDDAFEQSLALVAERVRAGEDFKHAIREFLDEFKLLPRPELKQRTIDAEPAPTGSAQVDAYLGAVAEHMACMEGLVRPDWSIKAVRFLERFWFYSDVPGFRAIAIAQSPAAFRRRGIFIAEGALQRV